jgi:hypothetical protein
MEHLICRDTFNRIQSMLMFRDFSFVGQDSLVPQDASISCRSFRKTF